MGKRPADLLWDLIFTLADQGIIQPLGDRLHVYVDSLLTTHPDMLTHIGVFLKSLI